MQLKHSKLLLWEGELSLLLGAVTAAAVLYSAYLSSWGGVLIVLVIAAYLFMVLGYRCDQEFLRIHNFGKEES